MWLGFRFWYEEGGDVGGQLLVPGSRLLPSLIDNHRNLGIWKTCFCYFGTRLITQSR